MAISNIPVRFQAASMRHPYPIGVQATVNRPSFCIVNIVEFLWPRLEYCVFELWNIQVLGINQLAHIEQAT